MKIHIFYMFFFFLFFGFEAKLEKKIIWKLLKNL